MPSGTATAWARASARAALAPLSLLYASVARLRNVAYDRGWLKVERSAIPVISVGNLTVGGTGKTPFTAFLASKLISWGRSPAIVMRGYGEDEVTLHRRLNTANRDNRRAAPSGRRRPRGCAGRRRCVARRRLPAPGSGARCGPAPRLAPIAGATISACYRRGHCGSR